MLGVGFYFLRKNQSTEDYYVGGRNMQWGHVGLSVVATDVGGGFSIGLGGLGFVMGISGSWMLFTGLIGAWLGAVFLIPKIKANPAFAKFQTFPEVFGHYFGPWVVLFAAVLSAVGYLGFTSSQILAGAKLANGAFVNLDLETALIIMGSITVLYTVMGGLKAVIYTDTIQWAVLMFGLIFIGIPWAYVKIGGWQAIESTVHPELLSLTNISWATIVNWAITIIPIWFVGMTLYQRIYASKDVKSAKKAWYMAGLLEYPTMAFMGVALGLFARIAADQGMFDYLGASNIAQTDPETGIPMLLRTILPIGLMGLMMSAYFSAILSTADSCLMAASGNITSDIIGFFARSKQKIKENLVLSQIVTFAIGAVALLLASAVTQVLDLMLKSYAIMVSGLIVPIIGALYWNRSSAVAAGAAMLVGGGITLGLQAGQVSMGGTMSEEEVRTEAAALQEHFPMMADWDIQNFPKDQLVKKINYRKLISFGFIGWYFALPWGLDPIAFGIVLSALSFIILTLLFPKSEHKRE